MTRLSVVAVLAFSLTVSVLAQTANLRISTPLQSPQYHPAGHALVLYFDARNDGPDVAREVTFTVEIPAGVIVEEAHGPGLICDTALRPMPCAIGDVAPSNLSRLFNIRMSTAPANASYPFTVTFTSPTPDPDPSNNRISVTFESSIDADLHVEFFNRRARVDPGGSHRFTTQLQNYFETIPPSDLRMQYDATAGATIEKIEAPAEWSCMNDGQRAVCTAAALDPNCRCSREIFVTLRSSDDRRGGVFDLRVSATSNLPERFPESNEDTAKLEVYRWLAVTSTADAGPGSLRATIENANAACNEVPCKIMFEIPAPVPPEGWFTIVPSRPLPPITADRVFVDGLRQASITGETNAVGPEIAIDGRLAHEGLEIHAKCEAVIRGLALGNFDANQALWISRTEPCESALGFDRRSVSENHIGVDPSGKVPWPNLRGLRADGANHAVEANVIAHNTRSGIWIWYGALSVARNRIESNGASGIFVGPHAEVYVIRNTFTNNFEMGVAAARGGRDVSLEANVMRNNGGLGIDWGLDGVSRLEGSDETRETNAPVLLSARYEGGRTFVTLQWRTTPLRGEFGNAFYLELFANAGPDGDGETPLAVIRVYEDSIDGKTIERVVNGDYRGMWITATGTRDWQFYFAKPPNVVTSNRYSSGTTSTSEMSNAVLVP